MEPCDLPYQRKAESGSAKFAAEGFVHAEERLKDALPELLWNAAPLSLIHICFTDETPAGQEEISLTVHLDNGDFPTVTLMLYRLDGTNCVAAVDGKTVALVSRSKTVDLIEAVNELTLGG